MVPLNSSPLTGTSYQDFSVSGQTTYYYVIEAVNATGAGAASAEAMATTPAPPVTFTQNLDIGAPQKAGSEQYAAQSGVYTVAGGGADIWGSSDSFHFDGLSLSGNGSIVAQVTSVQNTSYAAKAGIMFRDSTSADAMMAMLAVTPGAGVMFETRTTTGGQVTATGPWSCGADLAGAIAHGKPIHRLLLHGKPPQQRKLDTSRLVRHGADVEYGLRGAGGYGACRLGLEHEHLFWRERLVQRWSSSRSHSESGCP